MLLQNSYCSLFSYLLYQWTISTPFKSIFVVNASVAIIIRFQKQSEEGPIIYNKVFSHTQTFHILLIINDSYSIHSLV